MVRLRLRRWPKLLLTQLRPALLALMACLRLRLAHCHHPQCTQAVASVATRLASNGSLHPPCEARRLQLGVALPASRLLGLRLAT